MICKICNKDFNRYRGLSSHITKNHDISLKDYYDIYEKQEGKDICPTCGKTTPFISIKMGYKWHCNQKCANNDPKILNTKKETCFNHFGVYSYMKTSEFREKALEAIKSEEAKEKRKQTMLARYNNEYAIVSNEVQQKCKETNLKNLGVEYPFQSNEIIEKTKKTIFEKYNVTNPYNIPEIQEKANSPESREKMKQTCLENWGVESPLQSREVRQKVFNSMKENGNYSSYETFLEEELNKNNIKYETQYKDNRYLYHVDFYLIDTDTFVEINGWWHHGKHWFNENNKQDLKELNKWYEKAKTNLQYKAAINIWTKYDLEKREFARKNNLNYVVLWSKEDIIDWINNNFEIRKDF